MLKQIFLNIEHMIKSRTTIILLLAINHNHAAGGLKTEWMELNRADGCVSLNEIYMEHSYLKGYEKPADIYKKIKEVHKDAIMRPFIDYILEERSEGERISENEKRFFRSFSKKNAVVIASKENGLQIILATRELCKKITK
ncbi:hypothetical protein [Delftia tsuruhatensis]|uniref:hypothetical protein n=1 Tax=Delftia tsuruhatensis TaxID=180282 RepID=UPI001F289A8E|nr:hypothetical protein [Delftia tsuruhatensis]